MTGFETSLLAAAEIVAPEITDLFAQARSLTLPALRAIDAPGVRQTVAPLMLRAHLSQSLTGRKTLDTEGWNITLDPLHMMGIKFVNPDLNATFRVLKERDSYPGRVPTAKPGTQRAIDWHPTIFGENSTTRLLCLYDIDNVYSHEHWETPLRFVRPTGTVPYGKPVPYDLSIPLVVQAGFYANQTFQTTDDTDFFAQFRREENES